MNRRATQNLIRTLVVASMATISAAGCRSDGLISGSGPGNNSNPAPGGGSASPGAGAGAGAGAAAPGGGTVVPGALGPAMPAPGVTAEEMPADVTALLSAKCAGCHTYGQADPAGWGSVLDVSRMIDSDVIVAGDPAASRLIDRVAVSGDMPPKGERLKAAEVDMLKKWISGLRRNADQPMSEADVLDAIAVDQLRLRDRSADYRYVSFAHFIGQGRSDVEMEATRQVFTFILNSLSRRGTIVDLETIDDGRSIYRLRLSDLGWDEALWDTLTGFYPYCIKSDSVAHQGLYDQLRTEAPVVRGDWFLATATKAPLYDLLVDTPDTVDQLAARLGVDINDDINHPGLAEPDNLLRVGFRRSGVAIHNRMLERHLGAQGQALWISYDFDSNQGRADLMANPLGPADRDDQNFEHTFQHAGGEVIYTLPNGLQGYMVVNAAGDRLDEVPLNIARDPRRRDAVVENALSCFGCHGTVGLLRPRETDEVGRYTDTHIAQFLGRELLEIESTYPRVLRPDVFTADSNRYRAIADTVTGGGPPKGDAEYTGFVALVGQYESNVGFRGAAAEFHEAYGSFRDRVLANDFQNIALPRTATSPLVLRDDFVCVYRDLITKIRPNAVFCDKTFEDAAVVNSCSGSRSVPQQPSQPRPSTGSGGSSGGSSGAGGSGGSSGTGGRGGSTATAGRGGSSATGTGGSGGSGGAGGNAGGSGGSGGSGTSTSSDAGTDVRCERINGQRVCR
jgi:hypothetical protein